MKPQSLPNRAQLVYFLEQNELEALFNHLKDFIQNEGNQQYHNELVLLLSRHDKYLHNLEFQLISTDQLLIEYNQIKYALLTFINILDLPEGELNSIQKKKRDFRQLFGKVLDSDWRWSLLIAVFSLFILGFGQNKISSADFELQAKVSQVGLRTFQEWKIGQGQNLTLGAFEVDVVQKASFTNQTSNTSGSPFSFQVRGRTRLDQLFIPLKESLTLINDGGELIIQVAQGPVQGSVQVNNVELSSPELELNQTAGADDGGEQIDFLSDYNPSFYLTPLNKAYFSLPPVRIDSIGFDRLSFDQDSSTIKSGMLNIEGLKTTLHLGDRLKLKLQSSELKLNLDHGEMAIRLRGTLQQAHLTQLDKHQSLMPSWLVYLKQNQAITFYTGAFAALFGFLYPLRKSLFRHKN